MPHKVITRADLCCSDRAARLTVTRGRTIRGQVPNAECAQWTNDDRSEPYVGAMVVREHYRKFKNVRLVELLYDDL